MSHLQETASGFYLDPYSFHTLLTHFISKISCSIVHSYPISPPMMHFASHVFKEIRSRWVVSASRGSGNNHHPHCCDSPYSPWRNALFRFVSLIFGIVSRSAALYVSVLLIKRGG